MRIPWVKEMLVRWYLLPGAVSLKAPALPLGVQQAFGSEINLPPLLFHIVAHGIYPAEGQVCDVRCCGHFLIWSRAVLLFSMLLWGLENRLMLSGEHEVHQYLLQCIQLGDVQVNIDVREEWAG